MKLIDFDGMFDEKLKKYMSENKGKYNESEWENLIPSLYRKFGQTQISSLGCTPCAYYAAMDDDTLIECLKGHLKKGVPVSEFLCDAIESRKIAQKLFPLLDLSDDERDYAMSLIGSDDRVIAKYLDMLVKSDDDEFKERCAELIKEKADLVTDAVLDYFNKGVDGELMLEILSRTVIRRDDVFDVLIKQFRSDIEKLPMHAGYLAAYGDERALPYLFDKIDEEGISFVEFRELKFAIESLGGEYEKERDFTSDPYYELIMSHSNSAGYDIFEKGAEN